LNSTGLGETEEERNKTIYYVVFVHKTLLQPLEYSSSGAICVAARLAHQQGKSDFCWNGLSRWKYAKQLTFL
jgi:hypothetical protein